MKKEAPPDIPALLRRSQAPINRAMARHLPKRVTRRSIERLFGRARYAYDRDAIQKALADPVWDLLDRGGKRWRSVLFLTILDLFGKKADDALEVAVAFELIHNGTLIVDDLEDGSALRRGKPAIHRRYGDDVAVNAGNALYYLPLLRILARRDLPARATYRILRAYIEDMGRLHAGQGTDIIWHRGEVPATRITERQYLQMCAYKTGCLSRLVATAAAIIGGATEKQLEALRAFAETLGVAFQIQDDILNITESRLAKQKGLGEDITEGKRSLAVIYALQRATPKKRARLLKILRQHTTRQATRNEAIAIIRETGAIERAQKTMQRLFHRAWNDVNAALPDTRAKAQLRALAEYLIERDV